MLLLDRLLDALPVRRKLVLLTLLTSAVALFLSAAVYSAYQLHELRRDGERQLALVAALVAEQSRVALRHGDGGLLQATLERLAAERLIEAGLVAGDDGRPVAAVAPAGGATPLALAAGDGDAGEMVSRQSVIADGRPVASVYLRADASGLYSRMTREGLVGGGMMLASFAVALLVSARLRRAISEPLENMTHAALPGDPAIAGGGAARDEIGVLAASLRGFRERLRREAEERLRDRHLHEILLEAGPALLSVDPEGLCTPLNAGLARLLRRPVAALAGERLPVLVHPADADGVSQWLDRARAVLDAAAHEFRLRDAGGDELPVRGRARRLEGDADVLLVSLQDLREIRASERTRQRAEARLEAVHACVQDALIEVDRGWKVVRVSSSAARLLGAAPHSVTGQRYGDLDAGFDPDEVAHALAAAPAGCAAVLQTALVRRDGRQVRARVSWLALPGRDGALACLHDLSRLEAAERERQAARDAEAAAVAGRDTLIRNIGHDVRNPVTALVAAADMLRRERSEAGRDRCVEMVDSSSRALLDVVDRLCDLARLGDGCLVPDCVSFDTRPVLESVLDVHAARAAARGLELCLHVSTSVPRCLRGDPRLLRQLLALLVGGAVRHAERDAVTVDIAAQSGATSCLLRAVVSGQGAGLAGELRAHLGLEASEGGDAGSSHDLVRALCEALHARLEPRELAGAGFQIALELVLAQADAGDARGPPLPAPGQRLLLLHANPAAGESLARTLADLGVETVSTDAAREAMARMRDAQAADRRFGFVLVDDALPGHEARNLLQAVRGDPGFAGTRLLLIRHLAGDESARALADAELVAPVHPSALARVLADLGEGSTLAGPPPAALRVPLPATCRRRVLVADDDDGVQAALCLMLESLGYAADGVADGAAARAALERRRYDVVLLDCRMSVTDGFDEAEALIETCPVPVVAISACMTPEDERRLAEMGVRACLCKPIREESLVRALRLCLPHDHLH